jgi:hypothetical protein
MRRWLPKIGDRVKLKDTFAYAQMNRENDTAICLWAWFKVEKLMLKSEYDPERIGMVHVDADIEKERVLVSLDAIEKPFGWKPTYEIWAGDEAKARNVVENWFKRGIHVWVNHDLGSSSVGGHAFTPMDVEGSPHWKYTGNPVESILPSDCETVFQVGWQENKYDYQFNLPSSKDKKARKLVLDTIKKEGWTVERHGSDWYAWRSHVVFNRKEG